MKSFGNVSMKQKIGQKISVPCGFFGDFDDQDKITVFKMRTFKESKNRSVKKSVRRSLKKKARKLVY